MDQLFRLGHEGFDGIAWYAVVLDQFGNTSVVSFRVSRISHSSLQMQSCFEIEPKLNVGATNAIELKITTIDKRICLPILVGAVNRGIVHDRDNERLIPQGYPEYQTDPGQQR